MEEIKIGSWRNKLTIGSIKELKLVGVSSIETFELPYTYQSVEFDLKGNFELKDGAEVYKINFYKKQCTYTATFQSDANGGALQQQISCGLIPTVEIDNFLLVNRFRKWIAFFSDFNDRFYVLGSLEQPLELSTTYSIGATVFQLKCTTQQPVISITSLNLLDMAAKTIDLRRYALRDIIVYAGDTISEVLVFRDANGSVENLTGSSFLMHVRMNAESGAYMGLIATFTMGDGFTLQNQNNELLMQRIGGITSPGEYIYDLQRTYPDGSIETVMKGKFIVESQITVVLNPESFA